MATVYFKEALVGVALNLLNLKSVVDKLKAKNDIDQMNAIPITYCNG